ncbi:FAD-binding oxidoreductase [Neisseriaceae bacterium TC5R-5]|nr:FAD-binding oxidoreductase [Neisseriaceae bacterium TC5R-5]
MMQQPIVVVGAGVVGIATALQLRLAGLPVLLLDKGEPARETSYGNAGALAISDVIPLAEPGMWRKLPAWLLDPLGPLAVRWRYLPTLAPWLLRFAAASRPRQVAHLTQALAALLNRATADYEPLVAAAGIEGMWRRHGSLTLYQDAAEFGSAEAAWAEKSHHGIDWHTLHHEEVQASEPQIDPRWQCAVKVPAWSHVDDPYLFTRGLFDAFIATGGVFQQCEVTSLQEKSGMVCGVETLTHGFIAASSVVVTAGIWSDRFTRQYRYRVPLESERGYHITLPQAGIKLHHFIQCASESFVILPMANGGLRLAGTVELASRAAAPNWQRAYMLLDKARRIVGDFSTEGMTVWMGNRPSLPDTLPVIGPDPHKAGLYFCFGHGHLGLTLAATSGALLCDMILQQSASLDLAPYRLNRF